MKTFSAYLLYLILVTFSEAYKKSLIYIKINNELACTGAPILRYYAFTTANCALKIKFKLPDIYGERVAIDFGDPFNGHVRAGIAGVSILEEDTATAQIDKKYKHRKLDYGLIQISNYREDKVSFLAIHENSNFDIKPGDEVDVIIVEPAKPGGLPQIVHTHILDTIKYFFKYADYLKGFPNNALFLPLSLHEGNVGSPVLMDGKLVGVIAFVNEGEISAMMVSVKDIPLDPQDPAWQSFCLGHNLPRKKPSVMKFSI